MSRSGFGVWRHKPVAEPTAPVHQDADQPPTARELDEVFEQIAILEAQYVHPAVEVSPVVAEIDAELEGSAPHAERIHQPPHAAVEPAFVPIPTRVLNEPRDPLFDFTPTPSAAPMPDPFTRPSSELTRSRKRYLVWGACLLAGVMLIQGGRWLYGDPNNAGSRAVVADADASEPQVDKAVKRSVTAAKEFALGPGGEVRVAAAAPPLVLLEPDPATATKDVQKAAAPTNPITAQTPRDNADVESRPVAAKMGREPVRRYARGDAAGTEKTDGRGSALAATLKACREHGYHEAQCLKRACSVNKYGFACRGQ